MGNYSSFVRRFVMRKVMHLHLALVLSPMPNISCCLWGSISHKSSFYWQKMILAATTFAYLNITTLSQNLLQSSPSRRIHFSSAIPQTPLSAPPASEQITSLKVHCCTQDGSGVNHQGTAQYFY